MELPQHFAFQPFEAKPLHGSLEPQEPGSDDTILCLRELHL